MSFISLVLLALAMSMDAFTVSICKGISHANTTFWSALKTGLLFGVVEGITPVLGWLFGSIFEHYIEQWDHWIFFFIMLFLGVRMIKNAIQGEECAIEPKGDSFFVLVFTAISTSIDAFAVGAGLAVASVNIIQASIMIGLATMIMVTIGIFLGKKIGIFIGKWAELLGGIVLIGFGVFALFSAF